MFKIMIRIHEYVCFPDQLICHFFDDLHLQMIKSNPPKVSLEISSTQWALCFLPSSVIEMVFTSLQVKMI